MKLELNNGKWQIVKNGTVLGTFDTIKAAMDAKFDLTSRKPQAIRYFKQDGTPVSKIPARQ